MRGPSSLSNGNRERGFVACQCTLCKHALPFVRMATLADAVLLQLVFHHRNGLPRDSTVNTLWWNWEGGVDQASAETAATTVMAAFTTTTPLQIDDWMSGSANGVLEVRCYNWGETPPRTPFIGMAGWSHTSVADGLPSEVACCLSFKTSTGNVNGRHRGRIYLGPLRGLVVSYDSNKIPELASSAVDTFVSLGEKLQAAAFGMGAEWGVYSRESNSISPITTVWVDRAFDTQRRRGERASGRTSLDLP